MTYAFNPSSVIAMRSAEAQKLVTTLTYTMAIKARAENVLNASDKLRRVNNKL